MILAIDTATEYAGLALLQDSGIIAEEFWFSGRNHTVQLMPRIARMLDTVQIQPADLTGLAVALGPGSFTGLRIGLAVAKGMALPFKLPVVGVPTLEIVAHPFAGHSLPVWAVAQAGRGRLLAACYAQNEDGWLAVVEPFRTTLEELGQKISRPALCTGELDQPAIDHLQRHSKVQVVSPANRVRRAACLAEIAAARLAAGEQDDPDSLVPLYLSTP